MSDTDSIDMAPFFARHERRTRLTFIAMMIGSLALSMALCLRFRVNAQALPEIPLVPPPFLMPPILVSPLSIAALWIAGRLYGRTRPRTQLDGSLPMGADDARNIARVANAGAVFVTGYGLVMIGIQIFWALRMFGAVPPTDPAATGPAFRVVLLAIGALIIYFGNVGPRMPTPREPAAKPAVRMKYNRLSGWFTVVLGLLLWAIALFVPAHNLVDAVGGLSFAVLIVFAAGAITYRNALNARSA